MDTTRLTIPTSARLGVAENSRTGNSHNYVSQGAGWLGKLVASCETADQRPGIRLQRHSVERFDAVHSADALLLGEQLRTVWSQLPRWGDMAVQRLPGNTQFFAEGTHLGFPLPHGGHGQADLGWRHLERAPTRPPACSRRGQPCDRALRDKRPLELSESSEDPEYELLGCCRRVDRGALASEDLETDTAVSEVMDGVHQVAQVSAETVELPHQEGVALPQCFQARRQVRAVVLFPGGLIFVEVAWVDASNQERVSLEIGTLRPVSLRYPHVSDEHA